MALLFLTGFGPLVAWRKSTRSSPCVNQFIGADGLCDRRARASTAWITPIVELSVLHFPLPEETWKIWKLRLDGVRSVTGLTCFSLCAFTAATIGQEFYRGVKVRRKNRQASRSSRR